MVAEAFGVFSGVPIAVNQMMLSRTDFASQLDILYKVAATDDRFIDMTDDLTELIGAVRGDAPDIPSLLSSAARVLDGHWELRESGIPDGILASPAHRGLFASYSSITPEDLSRLADRVGDIADRFYDLIAGYLGD